MFNELFQILSSCKWLNNTGQVNVSTNCCLGREKFNLKRLSNDAMNISAELVISMFAIIIKQKFIKLFPLIVCKPFSNKSVKGKGSHSCLTRVQWIYHSACLGHSIGRWSTILSFNHLLQKMGTHLHLGEVRKWEEGVFLKDTIQRPDLGSNHDPFRSWETALTTQPRGFTFTHKILNLKTVSSNLN